MRLLSVLIVGLLSGLFVVACRLFTPAAPSIDGNWALTSYSCEGTTLGLGGATVAVSVTGSTGSFAISLNGCTQTHPFSLAYSSATALAITPTGSTACNPTSCGASPVLNQANCNVAQSTTPVSETYSVSGGTLILTQALATANASSSVCLALGLSSGNEIETYTAQ